ncbi:hypothetical protein BCR41DRAFT_413803 [Lobosporangium transversale]|uniref:Uncharacterized protein n=1 Tax=Lobosporangium transversale TaxID=64571 RepID=A0A1Y2G9Z5_9FUNG|nr:hypothetical protein BCR41DRAFT_413803 [Lobosporangium transversale]ORZ05173.1 hypothetical protein BCR41DRAFT_413803 [Lobosporangium transversale]|eukprot:XP_021876948.1 hypothetical protein BCR41DRAFT_413803 [Lobosporangium transversale]
MISWRLRYSPKREKKNWRELSTGKRGELLSVILFFQKRQKIIDRGERQRCSNGNSIQAKMVNEFGSNKDYSQYSTLTVPQVGGITNETCRAVASFLFLLKFELVFLSKEWTQKKADILYSPFWTTEVKSDSSHHIHTLAHYSSLFLFHPPANIPPLEWLRGNEYRLSTKLGRSACEYISCTGRVSSPSGGVSDPDIVLCKLKDLAIVQFVSNGPTFKS